MGDILHVLIVEDSMYDTELIIHELYKQLGEITCRRVYNEETMAAALMEQVWDVILADHKLPGFDSIKALELLKRMDLSIPFILISGHIGEETVSEAFKKGCTDYISKNNMLRLGPAIKRGINEIKLIKENKRKEEELRSYEEKLHQLAYYDSLTGLPNRVHFEEKLQAILNAEDLKEGMGAILFVDLDNFKTINDTFGHHFGDVILKNVGTLLVMFIGEGNVVARLGGDEFAILLSGITNEADAIGLVNEINESFQKPWVFDEREFYITASIGVVYFKQGSYDAQTLLKNADTALYSAKDAGKNNYSVFVSTMYSKLAERLEMESSLRRALKNEEFIVYYQPQIDLRTERIIGTEALIRWNHPNLGFVQPSRFIPVAEELGLIIPIGEWVLRRACLQNHRWHEMGFSSLRVSVNLSAKQFQQNNIMDMIKKILKDTGMESRYLELEITETIAMKDLSFTIKILKELNDIGIKIALDDFGTGYSSLNYLRKLPISILKMDKSFINDITKDSMEDAIAEAIIKLAHKMKLDVVAEGIETREQVELLRAKECDMVQGYFYSHPLPAEKITELLRNGIESKLG